jgi:BirA family transcriptional regulator, biotin operon repressor / biotin---[acetyl-CoA-carboxylase] ligase
MQTDRELSQALAGVKFARLSQVHLVFLASIDSTQSYISNVLKSTHEGDLVVSEVQTAGRGREGRSWVSAKGGLWMTLTLTPPGSSVLPEVVVIAAESIVKSLENFGLPNCHVKSPNDVHCGKKKIAGVLADGSISGKETIVYLGIGVNINNDTRSDSSISEIATSLSHELGKGVSLPDFTVELLKNFDLAYDQLVRKYSSE